MNVKNPDLVGYIITVNYFMVKRYFWADKNAHIQNCRTNILCYGSETWILTQTAHEKPHNL